MEQLGKDPFNFNVPDNVEIVQRHEYEQKPIKIDDDIEFRRDVVDTKAKKQKTDSTDGNCSNEENKENIMPCLPPSPLTYKYAPTKCSIPEFDKKYFLPKFTKKVKAQEKKIEKRSLQKKVLLERLKANTEKMEKIKNVNK